MSNNKEVLKGFLPAKKKKSVFLTYCCQCEGLLLLLCCSSLQELWLKQLIKWKSCLHKKLTEHLERACEKMAGTTTWDEISPSSVCPMSCCIFHKLFGELVGISVCDSGDRKIRKSRTEVQAQRGSQGWRGMLC